METAAPTDRILWWWKGAATMKGRHARGQHNDGRMTRRTRERKRQVRRRTPMALAADLSKTQSRNHVGLILWRAQSLPTPASV